MAGCSVGGWDVRRTRIAAFTPLPSRRFHAWCIILAARICTTREGQRTAGTHHVAQLGQVAIRHGASPTTPAWAWYVSYGPTLPTCPLSQVGNCLGYTAYQIDVLVVVRL